MKPVAKAVVAIVFILAVCGYLVVDKIQTEESWRLRHCIEQTGEPCQPTTTLPR